MEKIYWKKIIANFGLILLLILSVCILNFSLKINSVSANESVSDSWFYNGWQYRKEHNLTYEGLSTVRFYYLSESWVTIIGNPTNRHGFQPVHISTIVECNTVIDGAMRKYLAYDSDAEGSQIRLYYTDDLDGQWRPYSKNPILSGYLQFRWPSVTYVNGVFHMFLTDRANGYLERWTSTDGINFEFQENVKVGGNQWKNPFIWFNPNDNKWYLYTHDASGKTEFIEVRSAENIEDLDKVSDTIVISKNTPLGSPTMMFYGGKYWLLGEALEGGVWKVVAYYSTTSPYSDFFECTNSPILSDDEACPMLLLNHEQNKAYLFTSKDSTKWYQVTYKVYLDSAIMPKISDLVDYQVRVIANYGNGIDNGESVYLNEHSRTDFSDIRFTWFNASSNSEIECSYWMENLSPGDRAIFWVKIPKIQNKANTTIYIYYGKVDAASISSGSETFDFFDDFNGDLSKWTTVGGTWKIENGELSAETTASPFGQRIRANNFVFGNHSVHVRIKWISGTYFEHGPYVRGQQPDEPKNGYMTFLSTWPGDLRHRISKMSNEIEYTLASQGTINPSKDVWYYVTFKLFKNQLKASISPLYSTEITIVDNTFNNGTLCLFSWSAASEHVHYDNLFVRKYVDPEPNHGAWGMEEVAEYIIIDQSFVSDGRADVGSIQTVSFHAKWNNNGSDVIWGSIYVNGTEHITNNTGWISFTVTSSQIGEQEWAVTAVNCGGVTAYIQTAPNPTIIWDCIQIINGGATKESAILGETVTIWFQATYEYDNKIFNNANGILYVNNMPMTWSITNNRWEYQYAPDAPGTKTFTISEVQDNTYGLTAINDVAGTQTITVWSTPFSIISNSTITELAFNSTTKTITFTLSGPHGTTGYTNITIAKTLINNITNLTIYLDDHQIEYLATATEHTWLIHFTYTHSTHKVTIQLTQPNAIKSSNPQPETTLLLSGILIIITATPLIHKKVRRKTHNPRSTERR
jgi:hypothetical protein